MPRTPTGSAGRTTHWSMPRFDAAPQPQATPAAAAADVAQEVAAARAAAEAAGRAEGRAAGHAEGFAEGRTAGHAEGLEAGRAAAAEELDRQLDAWSSSVEALVGALRDARAGADDLLVDALAGVVAQVARGVLVRELATSSEALNGVLRLALDDLREAAAPVQVQGSPAVLAHLREIGLPAGVELLPDPALVDGCRVLQPGSVRDYLVSERFTRLVDEALAVQDVAPPAPPPGPGGE